MPLTTLFIIHGDTRFPMKVGIANFVVNGLLDYALRGPFGVAGIAVSTSLTLTLLCAVALWKARARWRLPGLGANLTRPFLASAASCLLIFAAGTVTVTYCSFGSSRADELALIAVVVPVMAGLHLSLLAATGASRAGGLPLPAPKRPRLLRVPVRHLNARRRSAH
jgi:peptidoglycan biosynthesis protein MviN/MurJ (putative lipid II flippase)